MKECSIKCICCKRPLVSFHPYSDQPMRGTEFIGGGIYGSAITDVAGTTFHIIVCDDCIEKAILENNVREEQRVFRARSTLEDEFI